ncbi:MAG: cytidine deaminase [Lachnospiraceae bacterium]|nr:cytidine deaminase [Lachnospiraceae bacterium]
MEQGRIQELIVASLAARKNSYSPYSHYRVGAALLSGDGRVFGGCNVENASYPACICAERTAMVKAVSEGVKDFAAIAITGGSEEIPTDYAYPCGVCRQVMGEFCKGDFLIIVAKSTEEYRTYTLDDLLPERFEL